MVNFIKKKINKSGVLLKFRKQAFEGIGFTFVLLLIGIIMIANIIRVVNKGMSNYQIYLHEKTQLQDELARNKTLQEDFKYYSSDEAKILLARQVLQLGLPSETIYKTTGQPQFYEQKKKLINLETKKNYSGWWVDLVKVGM